MPPPFRVLILCTGNSARSQMAEAILALKGAGRLEVHSAGSRPAPRVNPYAIETLREFGIRWEGRKPRGMEGLDHEPWDIVITVCDRAKEACPIFPGQPVLAHWGMPDPAEVEGDEGTKRAAFREAFEEINRRIDLLLALPIAELDRASLERRVQEIGTTGPPESPGGPTAEPT